MTPQSERRKDRLAAALRMNLRRRKASQANASIVENAVLKRKKESALHKDEELRSDMGTGPRNADEH